MTETRKPYTVASYEAGKKAETRNRKTFYRFEYYPENKTWPFKGWLTSESIYPISFRNGGRYFYKYGNHSKDLFEKED